MMNNLFAIGEDVTFSDDDDLTVQFSLREEVVKGNNRASKNVAFSEMELDYEKNEFQTNIRNRFDAQSDISTNHKKSNFTYSAASRKMTLDNFLEANENDDFLSQIDLPLLESDFMKTIKNPGDRYKCDTVENLNRHQNIVSQTSLHSEITPMINTTCSPLTSKNNYSFMHARKNIKDNQQGLNSLNMKNPGNSSISIVSSKKSCNSMSTKSSQVSSSELSSNASAFQHNPLITMKRKVAGVNHEENGKRIVKPRKFPGPAGLLPNIDNVDNMDVLKSPEQPKNRRCLTPHTPKTPMSSVSNSLDDDFMGSTWKEVLSHARSVFPKTSVTKIASILNLANRNELLNGKVILICALIKSFSISGSSGKVLLKDPSGEISGTVHKRVLEEFEYVLRQGTGVILKDVSVFSPNTKKHYLNVTPVNIVHVFTSYFDETLNQSNFLSQMNKENRYYTMQNDSRNTTRVTQNETDALHKEKDNDFEGFFLDDMDILDVL